MSGSNTRQLAKNSAWLLFSRLYRMGIGVFVVSMIARHLGPTEYGSFSYALSLSAVFAGLASLGFEGVVIAELVKGPQREAEILTSAFLLRVFSGFIALGLAVLTAFFGNVSDEELRLVFVVVLALVPASGEVADLWFQRNVAVRYTVVVRSVAVTLSAAVRIMLVVAHAPLIAFAWAVVLESLLVSSGLIAILYRRFPQQFRPKASISACRTILVSCWPLAISALLVSAYLRVEQVLVMHVLGAAMMGVYFAAASLCEAWRFIPSVILASLYPSLVEAYQTDIQVYRQKMQRVYDFLMLLGLAVSALGILLGPFAIKAIFGSRFTEAIPSFQILVATAPFAFSGAVRGQQFLIENLNIYHTYSAVIGIAANMAIGILLMPYWGPSGAAAGSLAGYIVSVYLTSWIFPKLRGAATFQTRSFTAVFRARNLMQETMGIR